MTQEKNTVLTPEEQAELAEKMPALLEAIAKESPVAQGWLAQWRSERALGDEAADQAEAIRKEVAAAPPDQGTTAQWCGFPTDMTRCSPFFPMNPKELGHRDFLRDFVITSANWGEIKYTGPKLSTYEEDALMAVLAILDKEGPYKRFDYGVTEDNDPVGPYDPQEFRAVAKKTYSYQGPILPLLQLLGYNRPNKKDYQRFISTLELMMSSVVKISISTGKTKTGKRREPKKRQITNMLSCVFWDEVKKELLVVVNPYFYETYMAGRVTLMDVVKRMSLKGAIAKALYRFVQSQRQNPVFVGHFLTLADALNIDRDQPATKVRQLLKTAINELIRHGILMKKSGFVEQDIIKLNRTPEALPSTGKKKLEKR